MSVYGSVKRGKGEEYEK
ncbi:Protein of unknown function [Bacillus mycoides]|nr:Protein of unknown function [Bacillus mycoides]